MSTHALFTAFISSLNTVMLIITPLSFRKDVLQRQEIAGGVKVTFLLSQCTPKS